tara:strand:+ start:78 stop:512 length:435 start_codon:yes stop_codon:yes gene_type:complete
MIFKGNELYIADFLDNRIVKTNITDAQPSIEEVLSITSPGDITFDDEILYITTYNEILKIDLSLNVDDYDFKDLKLYPNPTTDYLKVANLKRECEYDIKDINGRVLEKGTLKENEKIGTSFLTSGTYFITFYDETITTKKFLKL